VNLKEKIYLYVNSTTQRCPNKIINNFSDWRFFTMANRVNDTLSCKYLREFSKQILCGINGILRGLVEVENLVALASNDWPIRLVNVYYVKKLKYWLLRVRE
jgi:hypothetical protein